jgi:hypothetical protein
MDEDLNDRVFRQFVKLVDVAALGTLKHSKLTLISFHLQVLEPTGFWNTRES